MSANGTETEQSDWNDTAETGRRMGNYPSQTLRTWRHRGEGPPYVHVGKHVRYHWPTVERWMLQQQVHPGVGAA